MSYAPAYRTQFHSLDDTFWEIVIYINGFEGDPLEIKLEADEPCVIEWQETSKTDVVQSSTCTLRVSNESDRQMVQLMDNRDSGILVSRNGKVYWVGYLDDAVYEEPYSFDNAYATDLIFSDFGILNRIPFTLTGKQSVNDIVRDCLASTALGNAAYINLYTSLLHPKTQHPITLGMLYINADRFEPAGDSWNAMTSKREVLEEVLRPLGLRVMQKNGQVYIYDIDYLSNHDSLHNDIVWKGTDAFMRGSESFAQYEVAFDHDALETLAESGLDYDESFSAWSESAQFFAMMYAEQSWIYGTDHLRLGFFVEPSPYAGPYLPMLPHNGPMYFRTRPILANSSDIGMAWRIKCKTVIGYTQMGNTQVPTYGDAILVDHLSAYNLAATENVFSITSGYIPLVPNRSKFQLRVNLDFLLSFRDDPIDNPPDEWVENQDWYDDFGEKVWRHGNYFAHLVPVKLEVVDDNGNPVCHYENAEATDIPAPTPYSSGTIAKVLPRGINCGVWEPGAASFGDMVLAYYKDFDPDDDDREPLVTSGWVGNRTAPSYVTQIKGSLYSVRPDGEYLPLPPMAGRLRLTVGSGVFQFPLRDDHCLIPCYQHIAWQLYRNPEIAIVRDSRVDDGINTDSLSSVDSFGNTDVLGETLKAGTWQKGAAPSSRGLFFDYSGNVWEKFTKNGSELTLQEHRLRFLKAQFDHVQPVLSGTAELNAGFCAYLEHNTPGLFIVTALRQDLHQDTDQITMACIGGYEAPGGSGQGGGLQPSPHYQAAWSLPLCTQHPPRYTFLWSLPLCTQKPGPYQAAWSTPLCTQRYQFDLDWQTMQEET